MNDKAKAATASLKAAIAFFPEESDVCNMHGNTKKIAKLWWGRSCFSIAWVHAFRCQIARGLARVAHLRFR
jgi:hypothetical protein